MIGIITQYKSIYYMLKDIILTFHGLGIILGQGPEGGGSASLYLTLEDPSCM